MQHDASLEHAPCFYFCTADDGTLLEVNEMLCTQLGFSKDELIGKKAEIIFTVATRIFYQTHLFPLLKMQHHAEEIYITLQTKTKEQIPVLINAERKVLHNKPVIVYVSIAVHNRKKFEDELVAAKKTAETALNENLALAHAKKELQQHIEQLDAQVHLVNKQNEELQQFNHAVTHDLQEPLRKLSVFADILLNDEKKDRKENIQKLMHVLEQMRSVMSGLQQYIWFTGNINRTTDVDLDNILSSVQKQLKNDFPEINFNIETSELGNISSDKEQMQLLFYHLLSNATRFRKPGGDVHINISSNNILLNKFRNVKNKYQYTDFLKIEIADNGVGFNPKFKEQIFDLFNRLHTQSGRGIGLALCKKIIENHNGTIFIDAKENEGATVTILLPRLPANKLV